MPRKKTPEPLDLVFMLVESCMDRLSPNAWKVVSYVAVRQLRAYSEWLDQIRDPSSHCLKKDLSRLPSYAGEGGTESLPYRIFTGVSGPPLGGNVASNNQARLPIISLEELSNGWRDQARWWDYGTGLGKSSVSAAVNEAIEAGIVVREQRKSERGRSLASSYGIDWDRVQENDWARKKGLAKKRKSATVRQKRSK